MKFRGWVMCAWLLSGILIYICVSFSVYVVLDGYFLIIFLYFIILVLIFILGVKFLCNVLVMI